MLGRGGTGPLARLAPSGLDLIPIFIDGGKDTASLAGNSGRQLERVTDANHPVLAMNTHK